VHVTAPLPREFYLGPPEEVAKQLLGKLIVRRLDGRTLSGRIVELEAYQGGADPAAHAFSGRTARNEVLFGPPGHAYVYFIYGMYHCLNVSCEPEGQAGCVLFRALEPVDGLDAMARLRGLDPGVDARLLTSGPGRMCDALGLTRAAHNGMDVTDPRSELQIVDDGFPRPAIVASPRIGIQKAADWMLRFFIEGNRFVSGPKRQAAASQSDGKSHAMARRKSAPVTRR
jgi:DNA-3-methyladenine glycosylase